MLCVYLVLFKDRPDEEDEKHVTSPESSARVKRLSTNPNDAESSPYRITGYHRVESN